MKYRFEDDAKKEGEGLTGLVLGSVDLETLEGELPEVEQHIFLREKAGWVVVPEDGARREETFEFAERMGIE